MNRLTKWNDKTEAAELKDWDDDEWQAFISDFDCSIWKTKNYRRYTIK